MRNKKQYDRPNIKIKILEKPNIFTTSELTNVGSWTGDCGGLPSETNLNE